MPDVAAHPSQSPTIHNPNQQSNTANKSTLGPQPLYGWANTINDSIELLKTVQGEQNVTEAVRNLRGIRQEMEQQAQKMTAAA